MQQSTINEMKRMGWKFLAISEHEWSWIKFDTEDKQVAVIFSPEWQEDRAKAEGRTIQRIAGH